MFVKKIFKGGKMKMSKTIIASAIVSSVIFSGCATIVDGKMQTINLTSSKPKNVTIDGVQYSSPGIVSIERGDKDKMLKMDGCDKTILLKRSMNPMFLGNLIFGGVFGSSTDFASKSMWKYDQDNIDVDCK